MKKAIGVLLGTLLLANVAMARGGDLIFPWNEAEMTNTLGVWESSEYGVVVALKERENFCAIFVKDESGFGLGQQRVDCDQMIIAEDLKVASEDAEILLDRVGGRKSHMIVQDILLILERTE